MRKVAILSLAIFFPLAARAQAPQPTSFSVSPSSIVQGQCYTISVGNGANMTLDVQWTFNNGPVETAIGWPTLDSNGQALVCSSSATATGTYTFVSMRNTLNTSWISISASITVTGAPDFSLQLSPSSQAFDQGRWANYWVSVSGTNGFSQPVTLSISTLPAGITASFDMNPVQPGSTATLTLQASSTSSTGTFSFTVTGSGGGLVRSSSATATVQPRQPTSMSFNPAQGFAGVDCYVLTIGNGASMTVDLQYKVNNGPTELASLSTDANGQWRYCLSHFDRQGLYSFTAIKNQLRSDWVVLSPAVTFNLLPPQPTSLAVSPSSVTAGQGSYTMSVGNGADVTLDTQWTFNNGPLETAIGWPSLAPVSPGSPNGQASVWVGPCTPVGSYRFTAIKNTLNSPWVSVSASVTVNPPLGPSIASISPSSAPQGSTVSVRINGSNLCNVGLSTSWTGLSFSNISFDGVGGSWAVATFAVSLTAPVGTATITLSATGGSTTFSFTINPSNSPPAIASISPEVIKNGGITTVTLTGTSLLNSRVSIPTESIDPSDPPRSFPTATVESINQTGTSMRVRIDATDTTILDFYNLVLDNGFGQSFAQFRVIPQGPLIDAWTPSAPEAGRVHILSIIGMNLLGASVSPAEPSKMRIFNVESSEDKINGMLEVLANAPTGPTAIIVRDNLGRQVQITVNIVASGGGENLTAALATSGAPAVYLQDYTIRAGLSTSSGLSFLCRVQRNIINFHWQFPLVFCPLTGKFGDECLQGINLGDQIRIGGFILSLYFRVDVLIFWVGNAACIPTSYPRFCLIVEVGAEIPGRSSIFQRVNFCNQSIFRDGGIWGSTKSITFHGNPCLEIPSQDPVPTSGVSEATAELVDCCTDVVRISSSGTSFSGQSFATSFNLASQPAAPVTPAGNCLVPPGNPVKNVDVVAVKVIGGRWATTRTDFDGPINGAHNIWNPQSVNAGFPIAIRKVAFRTLDTNTVPNIAANICEDKNKCTGVDDMGNISRFNAMVIMVNDPNRDSSKVNMYFVRGISGALGVTFKGDNRPVIGDNAPPRTIAHEIGHVLNRDEYIVTAGTPDVNNLMRVGGSGTNLLRVQIKRAYEYPITERTDVNEQTPFPH